MIRQCYIKDSPHIGLTFGFGNARVFIKGQTKQQLWLFYLPSSSVKQIIWRLKSNKISKTKVSWVVQKVRQVVEAFVPIITNGRSKTLVRARISSFVNGEGTYISQTAMNAQGLSSQKGCRHSFQKSEPMFVIAKSKSLKIC